jgi:hypothetical protein
MRVGVNRPENSHAENPFLKIDAVGIGHSAGDARLTKKEAPILPPDFLGGQAQPAAGFLGKKLKKPGLVVVAVYR